VTDPDHKTRAAPKLNVMAVNESLGLLDCLAVIGAYHRLGRAWRKADVEAAEDAGNGGQALRIGQAAGPPKRPTLNFVLESKGPGPV
jgi:hypothetical protein